MSQVPEEVKSRIIEAANKLYLELGCETFPKVDDVRRLAKADMNSTSVIMKGWRKLQTKPISQSVTVNVPESIHTLLLQSVEI